MDENKNLKFQYRKFQHVLFKYHTYAFQEMVFTSNNDPVYSLFSPTIKHKIL